MIDKKYLIDSVVCYEDESVLEASRILRDSFRKHLVVVNNDLEVLGVISVLDINNRVVSEEKNPKDVKISEIMTKDVITIDINTSYEEALKQVIEIGTHSVPVVENGKLQGLILVNSLWLLCSKCEEDEK